MRRFLCLSAARLTQFVERPTCNPKVAGSNRAPRGVCFIKFSTYCGKSALVYDF